VNDRLDRALRALREEQTGANPMAQETLDRVLASRRGASGVWARRARLWLPIAAVLVVATSALARSGAMATVRALVAGHSEETERPNGESAAFAPTAPVPTVEPTSAASIESVVDGGSASAPAPAPAPASASASARAVPAPKHASAPVPASISAPMATIVPPSPSAVEPPVTIGPSEADVYARAHRLHFDGANPADAVAAWDDYLRRYPVGRFAPDARYNRAIDLLKMKRYAEARAALQPFADGVYGGYHRDDARELLRSLP
jgi:hypothetical protein